nr:hypothetical protein [Tanacetum cinerariifolium]
PGGRWPPRCGPYPQPSQRKRGWAAAAGLHGHRRVYRGVSGASAAQAMVCSARHHVDLQLERAAHHGTEP